MLPIHPTSSSRRQTTTLQVQEPSALWKIFSLFISPVTFFFSSNVLNNHRANIHSHPNYQLVQTLVETHLNHLVHLLEKHRLSSALQQPLMRMLDEAMQVSDSLVNHRPLNLVKQEYLTLKEYHDQRLKELGIYRFNRLTAELDLLAKHVRLLFREAEKYQDYPGICQVIQGLIEGALRLQIAGEKLQNDSEIIEFSRKVRHKIEADKNRLNQGFYEELPPSAPTAESFI